MKRLRVSNDPTYLPEKITRDIIFRSGNPACMLLSRYWLDLGRTSAILKQAIPILSRILDGMKEIGLDVPLYNIVENEEDIEEVGFDDDDYFSESVYFRESVWALEELGAPEFCCSLYMVGIEALLGRYTDCYKARLAWI